MEKTEKREIIEEFLKFAKEVYDVELCEYCYQGGFPPYAFKADVEEIIDHFIKGE